MMYPQAATLVAMKTVGLRELKNRLSEYVRLVRAGGRVLVRDRGHVVAELGPPGSSEAGRDIHPGLAAPAKRGSLSLGAPNETRLYPPLPRRLPRGKVRRLIDEERGAR